MQEHTKKWIKIGLIVVLLPAAIVSMMIGLKGSETTSELQQKLDDCKTQCNLEDLNKLLSTPICADLNLARDFPDKNLPEKINVCIRPVRTKG